MPALIALAVLLEAAFLGLVRRLHAPNFSFLAWFFLAASFYLIAVARVLRAPASSQRELRFILLAAVVFRITLLPLTPSLSHDLWRFHWDGKIQHAGFNPYQYPPQSQLFNPIRTAQDQLVPAPAVAAYHPPLAELLFRWNFDFFSGLRAEKLLFTGLDLLLLGLLVRMLKAREWPPERVLIYAWSPLAVFEIAGNGHMESAAALLALLALHWAARRPRAAAVAIASAALMQGFALVLVPIVLTAIRRRWAGAVAWMVGWTALLTLPYLWINKHVALRTMWGNLHAHTATLAPFNGSLFALALAWFGGHMAWTLAVLVPVAAIAFTILAQWRRGLDPLRAGFVILGALLLVLPQVYPWYALWLLPWLVFWPEAAWLYFSVAVAVAYALPQHPGLAWVEYAPVFALLAWQTRRGWGRARTQAV